MRDQVLNSKCPILLFAIVLLIYVAEGISHGDVCEAGDILAPGENCTYPGTDAEFSVLDNGSGQFLFFSSGNSITLRNTTINGVSYTLVANKLASGSWEIEEIADSTAPPTTNTAPTFTDGPSTTRSVAENTAADANIGNAVAATDSENDTLTYTLSGLNATSFSIESTTGQLKTSAALDYETKSTYTVTITVSDGSLTDTITVTINITDVAETAPATTAVNIPDANLRAKIEAALGKASGDPISAVDMETLTSFTAQAASISNLTGLETATNLATLKLGDNSISDISALTGLTKLTQLQLWDNSISNISAVAGLTNLTRLYLWGNAITDISHVAGLTNLTHLRFGDNSISNISAVAGLTNLVHLNLKENSISNISTVAGLTNLTELVLGNNTISDISPVANLTKLVWLDMPNNTITDISALTGLTSLIELYFEGNSVSDLTALVTNTGLGMNAEIDAQGNPLNYPSIYTHIPALQARGAYVDFDNRMPTAPVKISGDNQQSTAGATLAQPFVVEVRDGDSAAFAGVPVTFVVTAGGGTLSATSTTTDANGRTQSTLTLGNTGGTNTVTVSAQGASQTAIFTATATTTNTAPTFTEGASATRSVAENTASGENIGNPIAATDANNDTLTYTLGGTDVSSFSIVNSSGQLQTKSALDYETKSTYTVTITVSDSSLTDTITVTINVTNVAEIQISTEVCEVGDVLAPGESCTYPGTDATFSVLANGTAEWNIPDLPPLLAWINQTSISGSLSISATVDGDTYHFVAEELSSGSWEIKEIGDSGTQQPNPPVQPPVIQTTAPTLSASTAAPLTEATLHEGIVTLTLSNGTYESSSFRIRNAITVSGINGVTKSTFGVERLSDTEATVELEFDGNMSTDSTLTISLGAGAIADYDGDALTAQLTVTAVTESIAASTASPLTEATLDESVVTLTLSGRTFEESSFSVRRGVTVSGIDGVTVGTFDVDRVSDTQVTVELTFDGTNFDTTSSLTFTVGAGAIAGYGGPALTAQVSVSAGTESFVASTDAPLTEATLDGSVVTLTLTGRTYESSRFTIRNAITLSGVSGLTIGTFGVTRVSDTEVTVELTLNGNIDTDSTLTITLAASGIANYDGTGYSAQLPVTASAESLVASTDAPLTEATLDESVVTLTLTGRTFESSRFTIRNAITLSGISGVTIGTFGVTRVSDTEITVELLFSGDFDTDATLTVAVAAAAIVGYGGTAFTAQLPVTAGTESLAASTDTPLTEATLDESVVTLTLGGRVYAQSSFSIRRAVTVSGIDGVTVGTFDVDRVSDTEVSVELTFDGTDFDTDATLTFTVEAGAIAGYDGAAFTAQLSVTAGTESLVASTDTPLTEATLHESVVTLTLSGRTYERSSFRIRDAVMLSGISGVAVGTFGIDRVSETEITVELTFDGNFQTDTHLTFTVDAEAIAGYNGPALTAQVPVTAGPEADANNDGVVDIQDLVLVASNYGQKGQNAADVNGDRVVNSADLLVVAGALDDAAAAPLAHPQTVELFTTSDIKLWLAHAQQLNLTDPTSLKGILFLEQLLAALLPKETVLLPNYPNPFNPETWIPYRLAEATFVTLTIYDGRGQVVRALDIGHQVAAFYETRSKAIHWDGRNEFGEQVASGVYFYHLSAGNYSAMRKMLILK